MPVSRERTCSPRENNTHWSSLSSWESAQRKDADAYPSNSHSCSPLLRTQFPQEYLKSNQQQQRKGLCFCVCRTQCSFAWDWNRSRNLECSHNYSHTEDKISTLTRNTKSEEQISARVFSKLPGFVLTVHAKLEVLQCSHTGTHLTIQANPW